MTTYDWAAAAESLESILAAIRQRPDALAEALDRIAEHGPDADPMFLAPDERKAVLAHAVASSGLSAKQFRILALVVVEHGA